MTGAPDLEDARAYLGSTSWDDEAVSSALAAEKASQAKRCKIPADGAAWPADLAEALLRRVAANLANRRLPLGVQSNLTEAAVSTVRVGGLDREVRRLEANYRKVTVG